MRKWRKLQGSHSLYNIVVHVKKNYIQFIQIMSPKFRCRSIIHKYFSSSFSILSWYQSVALILKEWKNSVSSIDKQSFFSYLLHFVAFYCSVSAISCRVFSSQKTFGLSSTRHKALPAPMLPRRPCPPQSALNPWIIGAAAACPTTSVVATDSRLEFLLLLFLGL